MNKLLIFPVLMISFFSCKTDNAQELYPDKVACDTADVKYGATVQPIIQTYCLNQGCHTPGNPSGGYTFNNYAGLTVVIPGDKLINALKYITGGAKNMPPTGKLSDCDIQKIEAWIRRGYPNN